MWNFLTIAVIPKRSHNKILSLLNKLKVTFVFVKTLGMHFPCLQMHSRYFKVALFHCLF